MELRRKVTTAAAGLLVGVPAVLFPGTGGPPSDDEGPGSHADRGDQPTNTGAGTRPGDETHEEHRTDGDDGSASFRLRALGGPSGTDRHDPRGGTTAADDPRSPDGSRDSPTGSAEDGDPDDAPDDGSDDGSGDAQGDGSESDASAPGTGSEDGSSDADGGSGDGSDGGSGDGSSADAHAGVSGGVEA